MATASKLYTATVLFSASTELRSRPAAITQKLRPLPFSPHPTILRPPRNPFCQATEVSRVEGGEEATVTAAGDEDGQNWVPVVPLAALPKGERRVIVQGGETILLLWYKTELFAIENRSPAEGAYTEGLLNAKLTQDGCIVCPTTDSIFDLQTGDIKEWYPKNPVLRALTPALRKLFVYPVKIDNENIYINIEGGAQSEGSAEIVFSGTAQPGSTASNVNVDEEVEELEEHLLSGIGMRMICWMSRTPVFSFTSHHFVYVLDFIVLFISTYLIPSVDMVLCYALDYLLFA